jgi:predicted phage terminase large subunit-like protein
MAIGIDLSTSLREKADYTVMTLGARKGNQYYILDGRRFRATGNLEKMDALIEMWEDWDCPPLRIYVEGVAYQASFAGDFRTYVINQRSIHNLTCIPVPARGDKLQRLRGVSGLFENGLVTFNQYRKLGVWTTELTNFGSHAHDDCVDSIVYTLQGLIKMPSLESC